MSNDESRQARLNELERQNRAMLARVKGSGIVVRPAHIDKLTPSGGVFNRGRKQTI